MSTQIRYYSVAIPATNDMSSYHTNATPSPSETVEDNALWQYNSARSHDNLPPLKKLPKGYTVTPVYR